MHLFLQGPTFLAQLTWRNLQVSYERVQNLLGRFQIDGNTRTSQERDTSVEIVNITIPGWQRRFGVRELDKNRINLRVEIRQGSQIGMTGEP